LPGRPKIFVDIRKSARQKMGKPVFDGKVGYFGRRKNYKRNALIYI